MTALTSFSDYAWAQALAWTLIHFVWQGALIGLAAFVILRTVRLSSAARYGVGVVALTAMFIAPMVTYALVASAAPPATVVEAAVDAGPALDALEQSGRGSDGPDAAAVPGGAPGAASFVPFILMAWAAGVLVLTVRLAGGWWVARRLVSRSVRPVTHEVHAMARRVAGRLALDRVVRFAESSIVAVPVTVGWLKPVVLLPAAAMSGLSTTQVEALLAHELAHVRRHDYLVNLLQSVVETLLFFHPAVWWASSLIRTEREHCCDDLAVGVCDRIVYVSALSDLAAMSTTPRMAMAATNGSLLTRVRRLLGKADDAGVAGSSFLPVMLVALVAAAFVPAVVAQSGGSGGSTGSTGTVASTPVARATSVRGGVAVGVPRGVAVGVPGGVVTGVAVAGPRGVVVDQETRAQATRQAAETRARTRTRSMEQAIAEAQEELQQRRRLFENGLITSQQMMEAEVEIAELVARLSAGQVQAAAGAERVAAQVAEVRAALAQAEVEVRRIRELQDRGLISRGQVAETERRIVALRNQLRAAERQTESRGRLAEVAAADAARQRVAAERFAEAVAEQRARTGDLDRAVARGLATRDRAGELEYALRDDAVLLTDADTRVEGRDVVVIQISGETRLPTTYEVDTDGAIRLPLLGRVQVRGLTIAEVRSAVSNMLADRQLAEDATVSVGVRRPRVPEHGR